MQEAILLELTHWSKSGTIVACATATITNLTTTTPTAESAYGRYYNQSSTVEDYTYLNREGILVLAALRKQESKNKDEIMEPATITVMLPSDTVPSIDQQVFGRHSTSSPDVEDFRGIPYGMVTKRWESSNLRAQLPHEVFDATHNGYVLLPAPCQPYDC